MVNKKEWKECCLGCVEKNCPCPCHKVEAMTDKELKWAIFGQCFQSNYKYLEILEKERDRRKDESK